MDIIILCLRVWVPTLYKRRSLHCKGYSKIGERTLVFGLYLFFLWRLCVSKVYLHMCGCPFTSSCSFNLLETSIKSAVIKDSYRRDLSLRKGIEWGSIYSSSCCFYFLVWITNVWAFHWKSTWCISARSKISSCCFSLCKSRAPCKGLKICWFTAIRSCIHR